MGVRRAERIARDAAEKGRLVGRSVFTYGPLIHNPQAIEELGKIGVGVLDCDRFESGELDDLATGSIVVIRAHGASQKTFDHLSSIGATVIDATCPRVKTSQKKAQEFITKGYTVVIAGEMAHGEVAGILGHADGALVVGNAREAQTLAGTLADRRVALLAQTTIKRDEYDEIIEKFRETCPRFVSVDTICPATSDRQAALLEMADRVDVLIVVGGKNSANTRRLFMAAQATGKPAFHIESEMELPDSVFSHERIGITAGASTPDFVVDNVEKYLWENKTAPSGRSEGDVR
jgi:4-hydroxy-3-methylbut-2-enyl diphosphate reductase